MKTLEQKEFITGLGFQNFSNFIFSKNIQHFSKDEVENINFELVNVKNKNFDQIALAKNKDFTIKNNFTIFTHAEMLEDLLLILNNIPEVNNINVISHMSDRVFTQKIYNLIPNQVNKIFTVNLKSNFSKVQNIPLGLGNEFSEKNLHRSEFNKLDVNLYFKNEINLYLNFNENTNYKERSGLYEKFSKYNWVHLGSPELTKDEYKENLRNSTFVLCPFGNGPDTHRVWETLYSGSIPIVINSPTFNGFDELPILAVESFDDINYEFLNNYLNNYDFKKINLEKLSINWWKNQILTYSSQNYQEFKYQTTTNEIIRSKSRMLFRKKINSFKKKYTTFIRKIRKKFDLLFNK